MESWWCIAVCFSEMSSSCAQPSSFPLMKQSLSPHLLLLRLYFSSLPAVLSTFIFSPTQVGKCRWPEITSQYTRDCNLQETKCIEFPWCLSSRTFPLGVSQFKQAILLIFFSGHTFVSSERVLSLPLCLLFLTTSWVTLDALSISQKVGERLSGMPPVRDSVWFTVGLDR